MDEHGFSDKNFQVGNDVIGIMNCSSLHKWTTKFGLMVHGVIMWRITCTLMKNSCTSNFIINIHNK